MTNFKKAALRNRLSEVKFFIIDEVSKDMSLFRNILDIQNGITISMVTSDLWAD